VEAGGSTRSDPPETPPINITLRDVKQAIKKYKDRKKECLTFYWKFLHTRNDPTIFHYIENHKLIIYWNEHDNLSNKALVEGI
jgi:hypothetical protein